MVELVRARWRLACASARGGLRERARVCWVRVILLEGSLLVRGAHNIVAAYVQDILGACTKIAKARCASTTLKL